MPLPPRPRKRYEFQYYHLWEFDLSYLSPQALKTAKPTARRAKAVAVVTAQAGPSGNTGSHTKQFLKDRRWARIFLPTLTHALYISREPFKDFTLDSPEFLAIVQTFFNLAFPTINFALSSNDEVTLTVSQITSCYYIFGILTCVRPINASKAESRRLGATFSMTSSAFSEDRSLLVNGTKFVNMFFGHYDQVGRHIMPNPPQRNAKCHVKSQATFCVSSVLILEIRLTSMQPSEGFLESDFVAPIAKKYFPNYASTMLRTLLSFHHSIESIHQNVFMLWSPWQYVTVFSLS